MYGFQAVRELSRRSVVEPASNFPNLGTVTCRCLVTIAQLTHNPVSIHTRVIKISNQDVQKYSSNSYYHPNGHERIRACFTIHDRQLRARNRLRVCGTVRDSGLLLHHARCVQSLRTARPPVASQPTSRGNFIRQKTWPLPGSGEVIK